MGSGDGYAQYLFLLLKVDGSARLLILRRQRENKMVNRRRREETAHSRRIQRHTGVVPGLSTAARTC